MKMGTFSGVMRNGAGLARAAEAMLRLLGGGEIVMRFKGAPLRVGAAGNPRLGLADNVSDDVALSPALIRELKGGELECVLPSRVVEAQVAVRQTGSAESLFDSALGLVRNGRLLRIVNVAADSFAGEEYVYRITVRE